MTAYLALIVTCDDKLGIGKNGTIPWLLKDDTEFFKYVTTGTHSPSGGLNAVVMGRRTWESIPDKHKPLRHRINIILSKTMEEHDVGNLIVVRDIANAISKANGRGVRTIYFAGGESVYNETINMVDFIYSTRVEGDYGCDVFVPEVDLTVFERIMNVSDVSQDVQIKYSMELFARIEGV